MDEGPCFTVDGIDWVSIDSQRSSRLERPFEVEGILNAIRDLDNYKSPCPHG